MLATFSTSPHDFLDTPTHVRIELPLSLGKPDCSLQPTVYINKPNEWMVPTEGERLRKKSTNTYKVFYL